VKIAVKVTFFLFDYEKDDKESLYLSLSLSHDDLMMMMRRRRRGQIKLMNRITENK
jgi:hypothetical protein